MLDDTNDRIGGLANTVKGYELRLDSRQGKISGQQKFADQLSLDAQEKSFDGRICWESWRET